MRRTDIIVDSRNPVRHRGQLRPIEEILNHAVLELRMRSLNAEQLGRDSA
jgi:hypothetical protein